MTTSAKRESTTQAASITLDVAEWAEITNILSENYSIWSGGLSKHKYYEWVWMQLQQPWSRNNYRYLIARSGRNIVSSCKLYLMDFQARGRHYRVGGIGAVYTPERFRGNGFAAQLLETVATRCKQDGFDAMLLYSDIDPIYYERLGYELLPNCEFHIWINDPQVQRWIMSDSSFAEDMHTHAPDVSFAEAAMADDMLSHYRRFLPTRPYGVYRSEQYWKYKLQRENFRHLNALGVWPQLEMMTIDLGQKDGGYLIFEQGGQILRVLEVVGSEKTTELLWRHLLRNALLRHVQLIRGWESMAPDFVKGLKYAERDWGHPMMLTINPETAKWLDIETCHLLELDHF